MTQPHVVPDQLLLPLVRESRPLVRCLTGAASSEFVANTLLAVGAVPAMLDGPEATAPPAEDASAVLINLGAPSGERCEAMLEVAVTAGRTGTPWVLDPVGAGSVAVRTAFATRLLDLGPTVIHGSTAEIHALAQHCAHGRAAAAGMGDARGAALCLARSTGAVVAVSGPVDLVTDGDVVIRVDAGLPLLTAVAGTGCALGAVAAAFVGVAELPLAAVAAASTVYGVAVELAAAATGRDGSFAVALLDALATIDVATVAERSRLS